MLDSTENEKKQKARKDISVPNRRSQCLGKSIHGDEFENTNDQLLYI